MNLEKLVPPLELCQQIPMGEFEDTCFFWFNFGDGYTVCKNGKSGFADLQNAYPAPTLQEIMAATPYCRVYKKTTATFIAVHEKTRFATSKNGAESALKLWLKLNKKGVE